MISSCLVTGGCGFIGSNVIPELVARGIAVRVLDNLTLGRAKDIEKYDLELIIGDVRDSNLVKKAVKGQDAVIHLAAHTRVVESIDDPTINFDVNAIGTFNLLRACKEAGVKKFLFASTGGAILGEQLPPVHEEMVPRPLAPYGASKLAGEAYCSAFWGSYGLNTVTLRFSNVYGPFSYHKGSVVAQFFKNILENKPVIIYGDGSQTRDFLFVDDLVRAVLLALERDTPGHVFQIASGVETSVSTLVTLMEQVIGSTNMSIRYEPPRKGEILRNFASIQKARSTLGYAPRVSLNDGLSKTWNWFLEHQGDLA